MNENNNFNPIEQPVNPVEPVVQQQVVQQPVEPQIDPSFGTNVSIPVQPVPEPAKKKSKLPIILIVILLLAAGGGAAYYFLVMNKDDNKTPETTTVAKKEEELKDQLIIEVLNKGIDAYETESIGRVDDKLYTSENYKATDASMKLLIALLNTESSNNDSELDALQKDYSYTNPLFSVEANEAEYEYVEYKDLLNTYKKIYNEDIPEITQETITKLKEYADGPVCPIPYYDKINKLFMELHACGGDSGRNNLTYKYKYEKVTEGDKETYYAYVAVGYTALDENDSDKEYVHFSYITDNKEDITNLPEDSFKINESNYTKFDKFKYVFVKDKTTGNIYVDHIEKVK